MMSWGNRAFGSLLRMMFSASTAALACSRATLVPGTLSVSPIARKAAVAPLKHSANVWTSCSCPWKMDTLGSDSSSGRCFNNFCFDRTKGRIFLSGDLRRTSTMLPPVDPVAPSTAYVAILELTCGRIVGCKYLDADKLTNKCAC